MTGRAMGRDLAALLIVLAMASAVGCTAAPPTPAASTESPRDPLAAVPLPGAANADVGRVDDAPLVSLVGTDVLLDGKPVGSVGPIVSSRRMMRIDGLFDGLHTRREAWRAAHGLPPASDASLGVMATPGDPFPGVILLALPDDTAAVVVKSVFQTAAFAGYPHARFLVRTPAGVGRLPVEAQVPGPLAQLVRGGSPGVAAGGLSPEQVRSVVMAHAGALRACYETIAQRDPTPTGGVAAAWRIDAHGVVSGAAIGASTLQSPKLEACILRQIGSWTFPSSDAPTTVGSYPFHFGVMP